MRFCEEEGAGFAVLLVFGDGGTDAVEELDAAVVAAGVLTRGGPVAGGAGGGGCRGWEMGG